MKKKWLAGMLVLTMLVGNLTGCGGTDASDQAQNTAQTESVSEEVTALSIMEKYNTKEAEVIDDNYRTYYEVFVYSFYDSDGNGIGDLKGLTQKLDYIADMGFNGIWLMPIMPSTTYHKYDVVDYYEIDPEYGTMDDFKSFMAACEERDIHVIIDLVMNHSSSKHEWFVTACDYLKTLPAGAEPDVAECPYVEYYNFSKEQKGGYSQIAGTEWYYEAQFWSGMPDLNLYSDAVRAEFEAVVDYWLELGVSGFRLDATGEYTTGNDAKNIEVLTWFNDMVKTKDEDAYIVAEAWKDITSYSKYYASGVSCFNFSFGDKSGTIANAVKNSNAQVYAERLVEAQNMISEVNPDYIDSPFYTNHDMGRSAGYFAGDYSDNQTKMAQALNLTMSGSAFLYYGEELGMKGSGKDENKRAPMYWSMDASTEGMCDGPKDMENVKMKYESLAEQKVDGNSVYNFVKQTVALRNQYPAVARGTVEVVDGLTNGAVAAVKKTYQDQSVVLIFNLGTENATIDISSLEQDTNVAGVLLTGTEDITVDGTSLTLPPYTMILLD